MPFVICEEYGTRETTLKLEKSEVIYVTHRTFSRSYLVCGDEQYQSDYEILRCVDLPQIRQVFEHCVCIETNCQEIAMWKHPLSGEWVGLYRVTCQFDSSIMDDFEDQNDENEDEEDASIELPRNKCRWQTVQVNVRMDKDTKGKRLENAVGEVILYEHPHNLLQAVVTLHTLYDAVTTAEILQLSDCVNKNAFCGYDPGRVRMETAVEAVEVGDFLWSEYTFMLTFDRFANDGNDPQNKHAKLFQYEIVHQGTKYKAQVGNAIVVKNYTSQGRQSFCFLDEEGFKIDPESTERHSLAFDVRPDRDFAMIEELFGVNIQQMMFAGPYDKIPSMKKRERILKKWKKRLKKESRANGG